MEKLKFYQASNGDGSETISLFAESESEAKIMARDYVEENGMEYEFPVIEIVEHMVEKKVLFHSSSY